MTALAVVYGSPCSLPKRMAFPFCLCTVLVNGLVARKRLQADVSESSVDLGNSEYGASLQTVRFPFFG